MHIDWSTLAAIAVVAAAATVTVVLLVSFAIIGSSVARSGVRAHRTSGVAVAVVCLVAAGLIVAYGLYLIVA